MRYLTLSRRPRSRSRRVLTALTIGSVVTGVAMFGPVGAASAADATPNAAPTATVAPADWPSAGQNLDDTHYSTAETAIGPQNVAQLGPKWTFTTGGDVSATPTVVAGTVYVPDWAGNLYAIDAATGKQVWTTKISSYTGISGDMSRTSPAFFNGELVLGDGGIFHSNLTGADVMAVNATNGNAKWVTQVDNDPTAIITGSPVIANGVAYVGVSSKTELQTATPTFRGSVVAINATTGTILWKTRTVPTGYTGGAVWASTLVVDPTRGLVYTGTGNNYTIPAGVCKSPAATGCTPPAATDYFDSIIALNMSTGAIKWATKTLTADTWTVAKQFGPDFDFGAGANLITTTINGKSTDLLTIGQKSGVLWALNPDNGTIVWDRAIGPGSNGGGFEWDSVSDGKRIYVANSNANQISTTLTSATGQTSTTTGGFWAAVDPATGRVLWETAVPPNSVSQAAYSMLSGANGVLYSGSLNPSGSNMFAIDMANGAIRRSFASGGSVVGGAAIVNGTVYWGSGYPINALLPFNGDNNKLYALSIA